MSLIKHLDKKWFIELSNGNKKGEGRLFISEWTQLKLDQKIRFYYKDEFIDTKIIGLIKYKSFEEMLIKQGVENVLPGINSVKEGVQVYREYYNEDDEKKNGVVYIMLAIM